MIFTIAIVVVVWAAYSLFCLATRRVKSQRGRVVLITGGARGIGRNMALRMSALGAKIVLWDMAADALLETKGTIEAQGGECRIKTIDVTDRQAVYREAREVGQVDVLINNAGIMTGKRLTECPDELMEKTVQVNTISHFWTLKAFLPGMLERNSGTVVTVASAASLLGTAGMIDYCASKFGAAGTAEALQAELMKRRSKVTSLLVNPYFINTGPGGLSDGAKTRFPLLLPILQEDDVAARVVLGIQRGENRIVMPFFLELCYLLKILPIRWQLSIAGYLGVSDSIDDFKGRKPVAKA